MDVSRIIHKMFRLLYYIFHMKQAFVRIRRKVLRTAYLMTNGTPPPRALYIEVTGLCNLQCTMCHRDHITEELGEMSPETFNRIVKGFQVIERVGLMGIGEPLANNNLPEMIAVCKSHGLVAGFNSNGLLLTPELTRKLILSGLDTLFFSVDGATSEVYEKIRVGSNFDRVIENIRTFIRIKKELGRDNPDLGMEFVASTENIHTLLSYLDLASQIGIKNVTVSHVITFSRDQEKNALYNHRASEYRQIWDSAVLKAKAAGINLNLPPLQAVENSACRFKPWECSFVSWKGDIKPCCTYLHPCSFMYKNVQATVPAINFGNVNGKKFLDLWYSHDYVKFRERIRNKEFTDVCEKCLYSKELIPA